MDLNIYQVDSLCSSDHHHKVEPGLELLEDSWFFGNLLDTKSKKMSRSFSDPCTSSNFINLLINNAETANSKSYEETYNSIKKLSGDFGRANLLKTPSLPPRMERKDRTTSTKGSFTDPAKATTKKVASKSSGLRRAPSLPNNLDNVDDHQKEEVVVVAADIDEESEFSMGKLIRQASLNSRSSSSSSSLSNTLPPRTLLAPKGVTASSTLSRARSKRTPESPGPTKLESLPESNPMTRPQRPTHPLKSQKSLSFIESKQLQGLKEQSKPTLSRTMSSFPDKHRIDEHDAFIPDSWLAKSASPPVPKWGGKRSKEEDVKAQIKFWARAVASNVRQEC